MQSNFISKLSQFVTLGKLSKLLYPYAFKGKHNVFHSEPQKAYFSIAKMFEHANNTYSKEEINASKKSITDYVKDKKKYKQLIEESVIKQNKSPYRPYVYSGRQRPPQVVFKQGLEAKNNNPIMNNKHFIDDEPGILVGTSKSKTMGIKFAVNNKNSFGYLYTLNYPEMHVSGRDVFFPQYPVYEMIEREKEIASVGTIPVRDVKSMRKYQLEKDFLIKYPREKNSLYQPRDYTIAVTSANKSEHEYLNPIYCSNLKLSEELTGIDIEKGEEIRKFINKSPKLTSSVVSDIEPIIFDALPKNMSSKELEEFVSDSLIFYRQAQSKYKNGGLIANEKLVRSKKSKSAPVLSDSKKNKHSQLTPTLFFKNTTDNDKGKEAVITENNVINFSLPISFEPMIENVGSKQMLL